MCKCSMCKFGELDYYYDGEYEHQEYFCKKGNDTNSDSECSDFKAYRNKYKEKNTICDDCEFLKDCVKLYDIIDCTTLDGKRRHVVCANRCPKKEMVKNE